MRGTQTTDVRDILDDLSIMPAPAPLPGNPTSLRPVHCGFQQHAERLLPSISEWLKFNLPCHKGASIELAGHSLGGASAGVIGINIAQKFPDIEVTVITAGAPQIARTADYARAVQKLETRELWILNRADPVPVCLFFAPYC